MIMVMGNGVIAFLASLSIGVWLYNKFLRRNANPTSSAIGATIVAAIAFVLLLTLLSAILP